MTEVDTALAKNIYSVECRTIQYTKTSSQRYCTHQRLERFSSRSIGHLT